MKENPRGGSTLAGCGVFVIAAAAIYMRLALTVSSGKVSAPPLGVALPFLANLAGLALVVMGLGFAVTGLPTGFFMSTYNKYSLSKLQVALWTVLVIAAFATAAEANLLVHSGEYPLAGQGTGADGKPNPPHRGPLDVTIPGELFVAMGISLASLAGASAALALKGSQDPEPGAVGQMQDRVAALDSRSPASVSNTGNVATNRAPSDARWLNVVSGDEVANAGMVDLSKVQQLLISLALVLGYGGMLVKMFAGGLVVADLPPLGSDAILLLAISHAGYLAYKVAPKAAPGASDAAPAASGTVRRLGPVAAPPPAPAE